MKNKTKTGKIIYIVHGHFDKLVDMRVSAYSKTEAEKTAIRRMKLLGGMDCMIDKIYSAEAEEEMNKKLADECCR